MGSHSKSRHGFSMIPMHFSARIASSRASNDGTPSEWWKQQSCSWSTPIARSIEMATKKKSSASSRRGKLINVSAESIFSRPLTKRQKTTLARIAQRQAAGDDSDIDYSDIPSLTDKQLAEFRRAPKVLVAARLDRDVYDWLKQYGEGYSTRINNILRAVMSRAR